MSLFLKDFKKAATVILDSRKPELPEKAPEAAEGGEKDYSGAQEDHSSKLMQAFESRDYKSFESNLRSLVKSMLRESRDDKPSIPKMDF